MPYGIQTWNASGVKTFDSTTVAGGVVAGVEIASTTAARVITYPEFAGRTGFTIVSGYGAAATWDYSLGYPRVTIPQANVYPLNTAMSYPSAYINMVK